MGTGRGPRTRTCAASSITSTCPGDGAGAGVRSWSPSRRTGPTRADPQGGAELRRALRTALLQLPPRQRAVLVLRYLEDYSEREVGAILECTPSTVTSQITQSGGRHVGVPRHGRGTPTDRRSVVDLDRACVDGLRVGEVEVVARAPPVVVG
ncbi:MAG TPA: sigma-70 family RNA polymerase sigma factor [Micromonosporaceae bacterium]|nr:sigma-70 family RNA polymerase sigma factor [Micromonosporaceae bacterium]